MKTAQVDLVLLSGYRGHGKDAFASFLTQDLGFKRYAFADRLKEAAAYLFKIPLEHFYDRDLKEKKRTQWPYMSPRDIVIKMGTNALRNHFDKDIWIRTVAQQVATDVANVVHWNTTSPVRLRFVITDVRFANEQKFTEYVIEELTNYGLIDRITVNKIHLLVVRKRFSLKERIDMRLFGEESDYGMFSLKYDGEILNFHDLNNLKRQADDIYKHPGWKFAVESK